MIYRVRDSVRFGRVRFLKHSVRFGFGFRFLVGYFGYNRTLLTPTFKAQGWVPILPCLSTCMTCWRGQFIADDQCGSWHRGAPWTDTSSFDQNLWKDPQFQAHDTAWCLTSYILIHLLVERPSSKHSLKIVSSVIVQMIHRNLNCSCTFLSYISCPYFPSYT